MGLKYYDQAIHSLITSWVGNPNIKVLRPDETAALFSINADLNNDKPLSLPLIALSRNNSIDILDTKKSLLSFDGRHLSSTEESTIQLNVIPIQLSYQIDIYTKNYDDAYEYAREFVFGFVNNPVITITIPYNGINLPQKANIRLQQTITDNSEIPERLFRDQFTRLTLQFDLLDAYLYSATINKNARIESAYISDEKASSSSRLEVMDFDGVTLDTKEKL